jgi:hypothetical protein
MTDKPKTPQGRRELLRKLARFTAVSGPAVTLLLAAQTKSAIAATSAGPCAALPQPRDTELT